MAQFLASHKDNMRPNYAHARRLMRVLLPPFSSLTLDATANLGSNHGRVARNNLELRHARTMPKRHKRVTQTMAQVLVKMGRRSSSAVAPGTLLDQWRPEPRDQIKSGD